MASKFNKIYRKIIAQMNDNIMRQMGFDKEVEDVHNGICPSCKNQINSAEFRDELSKREFKISGLCQKCQDEIFGTDDYTEAEEELPEDYNDIPEEPEDFRDNDLYDINKTPRDYQNEFQEQQETYQDDYEDQYVDDQTYVDEDYQNEFQDEEYSNEDTVECACCYEPISIDETHICYDTENGNQMQVCQGCYDGLVSSGKAVPSESDLPEF